MDSAFWDGKEEISLTNVETAALLPMEKRVLDGGVSDLITLDELEMGEELARGRLLHGLCYLLAAECSSAAECAVRAPVPRALPTTMRVLSSSVATLFLRKGSSVGLGGR